MSADPIDLDDLIERCEELSEADFDGGCCNASYPINGVSRALREAAAEIGRLRGEVAQPEWTQDVIRCLSDIADEFGHTGRGNRRFVELLDRIRATPGTPAPAMPNGVDSVAYLLDELRFSRRGYFTSQRRGELADKLETAIAADFDRLRAADNRDAAGVDDSHAFKNFHRSLCARFGYTHDENDWRRDLVSLEEHIARMAAHPSACELGAVRELVKVWRIAVNSASTTNKQDLRPERFIRELESALQHRGDSRGGEGS